MTTGCFPSRALDRSMDGEVHANGRQKAGSRLDRLAVRVHRPVPAASLAVFRMLFGAVATFGALRFLSKGWVETLYLQPVHHLTYPGFDWVQPWPAPFMYLHVLALAALGVSIAVGYRFRLSMLLYCALFTYAELIEASLYLNHYWFISMGSLVFAFLPMNAMWSLDARSGRVQRSGFVPAWSIWIVRFQLATVYVFAGIAKLQSDWLVHAQPLTMWLADRTELPIIGSYMDDRWVAYAASWSGAFFDCTIVGWLLWSKSRPVAYAALIGFHTFTGLLFQIGVFPWLMIAATTVFFSPLWPYSFRSGLCHTRSFLARCIRPGAAGPHRTRGCGQLGGLPVGTDLHRTEQPRRRVIVLLVGFVVVQMAIPLRHYAYAGDVRWTEEGYYGSWRVMLTEKGGDLTFRVKDPQTGEEWNVLPTSVLTEWQARLAATRPDLTLTTAHLVADDFARQGYEDVEVRADSWVSFNSRPVQRMIDPTVDLADVRRGPGHKDFILPLDPAVRS